LKFIKEMIRQAIIAVLCVSMIFAFDDAIAYKKFTEFTTKFNKVYSSIEEYQMRYKNFVANFEQVVAADSFLGESHTKGLTKFSDMSQEEFATQYLTMKIDNGWCDNGLKTKKAIKAVPASKDWRAEGKVTAIKDQGQCGSCWAFSAVAYLESQNLIQGNTAATFSEQQLVDCDTAGIDQGCGGGLMHVALKYFQTAGVESDKDYPYTASDDTCTYDKTKTIASVSNIACTENMSDDTMKQQVNDIGPLSIAVAANDFQMYDSGILECQYTQLNHGVLLVGYGTEAGKDFWIVKNSWGQNWGEQGFVRVSTTAGANCGIGSYIATATIKLNKH